jgi:hypothetical protein
VFGSPRRRGARSQTGLDRCALCRDDYVVPVWWETAGEDHWHMLLRCGECGTYRDLVVENAVAKAFEQDLDRGAAPLRTTLEALDRERMAVQTDAFIAALRCDLIDAGDFAGR